MCGILGTTNIHISDEAVKAGLAEICRRGPDNQSFVKNSCVVFGHTRLSIIDLDERSNQPFEYTHNGKSVLLTYNGEVYNFNEIKEVLQAKGYVFETSSDTEVIAASYMEWGLSSFDYFLGMWAIAIHDENKLIFSRDRTGKKPFYYSVSSLGTLSFGSSLKTVSILSGENSISSEGLELYFALGFIPKNYTIYSNISKLEPGNVNVYVKEDEGYKIQEIVKSEQRTLINRPNKGLKEEMIEAVARRTISDVPIATLMSGGVDSTIVTILTSSINKNIESFFVDFDDKDLSEKKWADYLSKRNSIDLSRVLMTDNDILDSFKDYYRAYEEPFADYSGIPSIAIFKKISKKYRVVLTGDGGDELFYGYSHYIKKTLLFKLFGFIKLFKRSSFLPDSLKKIANGTKNEFEANYLRNHGIVTEFAAKLINNEFNTILEKQGSFSKAIIAYDREFYNWPEKYLVKVDRASMFSSVEVRSPFMDEVLLKKVLKIPTLFLFTPFSSKLYLKLKYLNYFGLAYLFSKKKGFTPPISYLRNKYFNETDFEKTKSIIERHSEKLYVEVKLLTFKKLKEDKILFDRFFFFHEWSRTLENESIYADS